MEGRGRDTELPYGKIAGWGMAASAALTLGVLALSPVSPVCLVEKALDGKIHLRLGEPVVASGGTARSGELLSGTLSGLLDGVLAGGRAWRPALRGEDLGEMGPEARRRLRRELRRELRGLGPELRGAVLEGLLPLVPGVTGELEGIGAGVRPEGVSMGPAVRVGSI